MTSFPISDLAHFDLCGRGAEDSMEKVLEGEILKEDGDASSQERREQRVRSKFWTTLRKAAAQIPLLEEPVAAYYCALDPRTPARTRAILLAALAYFVLPADLIPDFLVGFGFSDDVGVLAMAIAAVGGQMTPAHREAARAALKKLDA